MLFFARNCMEIAWSYACSVAHLRRFGVLAYLPALDFICTCCEEVDELDRPESCCDNFVYCTLGSHLRTDQPVSTPGSVTQTYRADALQCHLSQVLVHSA